MRGHEAKSIMKDRMKLGDKVGRYVGRIGAEPGRSYSITAIAKFRAYSLWLRLQKRAIQIVSFDVCTFDGELTADTAWDP